MDHATKPIASVSAPPGQEIDLTGKTMGDYKILRRLGQGGMGQVFLAEQISLKRKVALKLLKPELASNSTALARFKAEAEAVAKATHANIVQVYAIHEIGGNHIMALEYVEGRNLREFLEKKGPPEVLLGLSIMRQIAAALQRASELGIIHRDIKPENILLTRKGEVKVADFGLSRVYSEQGGQPLHLTQSGITMGTPLYMSPEQVEGKKTIDHRTDIYSFGVTCYHMFAGHPPFQGSAPFEVALQHVQKEPVSLQEIRPDVPAELCTIIHKMMAKAPENRYQLGREIVRDVGKLRDTMVGASQVLPPAPTQNSLASQKTKDALPTLSSPHFATNPWPRRLLFAALPLALAGGLSISWFRNQSSSAAPSPANLTQDKQVPAIKDSSVQIGREKMLLDLIKEKSAKTSDYLNLVAGLDASIELGNMYLKDRERLKDADKFFNDLLTKDQPQFKTLGRLGLAMVLAFKDRPLESNLKFLSVVPKETVLAKDKKEKVGNPFWKSNPPLREMMAKALNQNHVNNPKEFPERLKPYLHPPAPTLKTPNP